MRLGEVVPLFPPNPADVEMMETAALLAEGFMLLRGLPAGDYLARVVSDLRVLADDPRMAGALSSGALALRSDGPHDLEKGLSRRFVG